VICGGLAADIFHDVDFAAAWPLVFLDVVAEHPEGGPNSLPCGDFDAGLEAAVGLREEAFGFEARGGVQEFRSVGRGEVFVLRSDDEMAVLDAGVIGAVGVVLEFVIAPTRAADVVGPFFRVGERAGLCVEFVAPDSNVAFGRFLPRIGIDHGEKKQR
jgi:hypothetical protein